MSIRGIVKHIDKIDMKDIQHVAIPNGIPLVYKFDKNMNPVPHKNAVKPLSGIYLEKKAIIRTVNRIRIQFIIMKYEIKYLLCK